MKGILAKLAGKHLKPSDYAMPDRMAYPIHDEAHARTSLKRVNKFGTDKEKKQVKAAIDKRFPGVV